MTREDVEQRIDTLVHLLANRPHLTRFQLHQVYCQKWKVHYGTVDRYLELARKEMVNRLGRKKDELVANSVAFYEHIIGDTKARVQDRLRAQARLDELLGLKAATKVELTGPAGAPLQLEAKTDLSIIDGLTVEELRSVIGNVEERKKSAPQPDNKA